MTAKPSIYGQDPTEENALVRNDEDLMTSEKIHALVQESRKGFRVQEYGYTIGLGAYAKADAWQL